MKDLENLQYQEAAQHRAGDLCRIRHRVCAGTDYMASFSQRPFAGLSPAGRSAHE